MNNTGDLIGVFLKLKLNIYVVPYVPCSIENLTLQHGSMHADCSCRNNYRRPEYDTSYDVTNAVR